MAATNKTSSHFSRDLVLGFALLSVVVIGVVTYYASQARRFVSQNYIDDAAARAATEFQSMVSDIGDDLHKVRDWIAADNLSPASSDRLNGRLFPLLKQDQLLLGVSLADIDGENYYATGSEEGWRTSRTGAASQGRQTVRRLWDAAQRLTSEEVTSSDYDPRQRPWFFPALSADGIRWTAPYTFFGREDVGVTAAASCGKTGEKARQVIAFDVLLGDLFKAIERMAPSVNSRVLILRRDAHLYVTGTGQLPASFQPVANVEDKLVQTVFARWEQIAKEKATTFHIRHGGETWWNGFRLLEQNNRTLWIGIMVPEKDILGGVSQRRTMLWWGGILVLGVSGALAYWLIRRHGRTTAPPAHRFDPDRPEKSIRRLIGLGEGRTIEFKSTMRMNLHTGKSGKEIELAWLKAVCAFMNTDGGTLLLGVTDDGEIAGLEPDGFTNQDKCQLHFKNLIAQHIGPELSRYLRFRLVTIEERQVGVVSCTRSPEPAYLKSGKKEDFFIRNGPSSDALPVSKVVSYIQNRS